MTLLCVGPPLLLLSLVPPIPPRSPTNIVYGHEAGVLKGTSADALLKPPVERVDDLWHLRDRTAPENVAHVAAESAYAAAVMKETTEWQTACDDVERLLLEYQPAQDGDLLWSRGADQGGWEYATRYDERGPYPQYLRRCASSGAGEDIELLLDANAAPALLPSAFDPSMTFMGKVRGVSAFVPSPSGRLAAYTVDTTGEEKFSLMVVELPVGPSTKPIASVADVDVDIVWGADDRVLFYATMDETGRPFRMHRLSLQGSSDANDGGRSIKGASTAGTAGVLGFGGSASREKRVGARRGAKKRSSIKRRSSSSGSGGGGSDGGGSSGGDGGLKSASSSSQSVRSGHGSTEVVLEENDARFRLSFRRAAEGSRLLVDLQSRDASEVWAMPFAVTGHEHKSGTQHWTSGLATGGSWHCLARREAGLTYSADYTHFDGGQYVLITNERGAAEEGALRILSEADALADAGRTGWSPNAAVADGEAGVRTLLEAQCFSDFAAIEGRVDGASVVLVWCYASGQVLLIDGDALPEEDSANRDDSPASTTSLSTLTAEGQWSIRLCTANEQRYSSDAVRIEHSSPTCLLYTSPSPRDS